MLISSALGFSTVPLQQREEPELPKMAETESLFGAELPTSRRMATVQIVPREARRWTREAEDTRPQVASLSSYQ